MTLTGHTVMVTGGTGFLGGALVRRLAADGVRVRVLARDPVRAEALRTLPAVDVVQGNLTDPDSLIPAVDGCSVVFHVAVSYKGMREQLAVNVEGTRAVAQAAAAAGVGRVVHVSSIAVYGFRRGGRVSEDTPPAPAPNTPYSITKADAERVLARTAGDSLAYSIIRPGMIYGPGSDPWTATVFRMARRRPIRFIGDGSGSAFPIHVNDVVDLMTVLAVHPAAPGLAFNCAPDPSPTWREWLSAYARLTRPDGDLDWQAIPPGLAQRLSRFLARLAPAGQPLKDLPDILTTYGGRVTFAMERARTLLGWSPCIDLQTGVAGCAPWLREQGLLA